jgi:hypothetical protein
MMRYTGSKYSPEDAERIMRETKARLAVAKSEQPRDESVRQRDRVVGIVHKTTVNHVPSEPAKQQRERVSSPPDPPNRDGLIRYGLRLADPDGVEKWREQSEELEQARQRAVFERSESETLTQLRADMWTEIEAIRAEMKAQHELLSEAVGEVLGQLTGEAESRNEKAIRQVTREFFALTERRYAQVNARIDVVVKGASKARSEKIRREKTPAVDLPNPLSRRELN